MKIHLRLLLALSVGLLWQPTSAEPPSLLDDLLNPTQQEQPLPPDEAFRLSLTRTADGGTASWEIEDAYYLYRHKTKLIYAGAPVQLKLPAGELIHDEFFGESQIFRHSLEVPFALNASQRQDAMLQVTYQGCADLGICYPPVTKQFRFIEIALADESESSMPPPSGTSAPVSEQFRIAEYLGEQALLAVILSFLGFGLLLALTPCVLPMIPILSGVVVGSHTEGSPYRAFTLSLSYVISMALVYALAGAAVGATGKNFQAWFQTPWVIGVFSGIFILLALSMFGLFEFKMPAAIQNRLAGSGAARRGSLRGAAIMGAASALIVGPCVTPPLVGVLLFIAKTGDALTGAVALFSLGIGMGIPLLAVGTSLGKWLPKPGPVLDMVKVLFGLLLLGVAVWLIDRVVPVAVSELLTALLLFGAASYLIESDLLASGWRHVWRSIGFAVMVYAALLLIGASTGGSSFLAPLENLTRTDGERSESVHFAPVKSLQEFRQALDSAAREQRPVMLDFYADWCVTCKEMEAFTFSKPQVQQAMSDWVLLQADVTANNEADKALLEHFGIFGPPAILFFNRDGMELSRTRVVGFMSADDFTLHLKRTIGTDRNVGGSA